jgi:hypothetical protein
LIAIKLAGFMANREGDGDSATAKLQGHWREGIRKKQARNRKTGYALPAGSSLKK